MPLSTGPTRFMPFSQTFDKGYTGVRDPRYIDYVKSRMVQLELKKGDAVFFNPATFHQPGVNETDQERVANLLQVSSPFGRSMESCDRLAMSKAVWPIMKGWHREIASGKGDKTQGQLDALVAATCSDYGYPKVFDAHVSYEDLSESEPILMSNSNPVQSRRPTLFVMLWNTVLKMPRCLQLSRSIKLGTCHDEEHSNHALYHLVLYSVPVA